MTDFDRLSKEETLRSCLCFEGPVFRVETHWVTLPDAQEARRDLVLHSGGVAVVPYLPAGEVILVRQYRKAVESFLWEIPAGKLEKDEDPLEAAKRELSEETGYQAQTWMHLGTLYPTPGYCSEILHLFAASDLIPGSAHPDPGEWLAFQTFAWSEVLQQAEDGRLQDAKTAIGILRWDRILRQRRGT